MNCPICDRPLGRPEYDSVLDNVVVCRPCLKMVQRMRNENSPRELRRKMRVIEIRLKRHIAAVSDAGLCVTIIRAAGLKGA